MQKLSRNQVIRTTNYDIGPMYPGRVSKNYDGHIGVVSGLVRSAFLVDAVYTESAREHGITMQQGQLLCLLMARPKSMGELGALLRLAKSSVTGLVERTERNGWVSREPDLRDARTIRVALTPAGDRFARTFYAETCARIERLTDTLDPAERDGLGELLGRVVADNQVPELFV
ncbi:MarR family winged helix-turn-helix transcriptional regulator [Nocardia sp. NPDC057668]|uniref:MarR family winged helix-turn-helix transcriptional regulator n=1 Tax=Nocardia sp. NPDC057668 TaxID=3346202 RepID=UPI00366BFA8A